LRIGRRRRAPLSDNHHFRLMIAAARQTDANDRLEAMSPDSS